MKLLSCITVIAIVAGLPGFARAQATQFRGYAEVERILGQRISLTGVPISLTSYVAGDYSLLRQLGSWQAQGSAHVFINGIPNSVNMLIWYTALHGQPPELQFCAMIANCFRLSISRSAIWSLTQANEDIDAHGLQQAKQQPQILKGLMDKIAIIFKYLHDTPFDDQRSLWDVTTVMVTSEFGRTLRGLAGPAQNSGTDHNNLTNTVLIGGKGILGGLVLGASDWYEPEEKLSGAHLLVDRFLVKTMGRPFDFKTWSARPDLPEKFDIKDYLTINSVVNTVYKSFGCPVSRYHKLGRNLPEAPTLEVLLKS